MCSAPNPEIGEPRRSVFGSILQTLLWIMVVAWLFFTGWRLFGVELSWPLVVTIAYTPYIAAATMVPILLAIALKALRRLTLLVICLCVLAVLLIPRAMSDSQPEAEGPALNIASVNLLGGGGSADDVVSLVKDTRVDVLSVQELTPAHIEEFTDLGLDELLPHNVLKPDADSAAGTGIYSKYPLDEDDELSVEGKFWMPGATIDVPDAGELEFVAVHPTAPVNPEHIAEWRADLDALPEAGPEEGTARVLAGDFNATLDHEAMRSLIGTGYLDAADISGGGLTGTWPMDKDWVPKVTLDHVLTSKNVNIDSYDTHDITGSDHRAVSASMTLPG